MPVLRPTVAIAVFWLVHVPPAGVEDSVRVEPAHTAPEPVMADGGALTVNTPVTKHPPGSTYEIMVVPAVRAVTIPSDDPIVATARLLLVHVPPGLA